jgi:hypothetical protein
MRPHNEYLDLPRFMANHPQNFKSVLIYDRLPPSGSPSDSVNAISKTILVSADARYVELPPAFNLILASQMQICLGNGYGTLSVISEAPNGYQRLVIQQGTSYRQPVHQLDCIRLREWHDQIVFSVRPS